MKYREAKSVDAMKGKRIMLEMVDLKIAKQIEMEQKRKNERKIQANI